MYIIFTEKLSLDRNKMVKITRYYFDCDPDLTNANERALHLYHDSTTYPCVCEASEALDLNIKGLPEWAGKVYTCRNSRPAYMAILLKLDKTVGFSRAEYEAQRTASRDRFPTLDTLIKNGFVYPIAYEKHYFQNEYNEVITALRYFYRFNF